MKHKKFWIPLIDLAAIGAMVAIPHIAAMLDSGPETVCIAAKALGGPCPSCGGTRCFQYFFTLQPIRSFLAHPIFFLLIVHLLALLVVLNCSLFTQRVSKALRIMTDHRLVIAWVLLFFIFGIIRCLAS